MFKFDAVKFHNVIASMQHTQTMITAHKRKSVEEKPDGSVTVTPISDPIFLQSMFDRAHELKELLGELGAPITKMAVDDMLSGFSKRGFTYERIDHAYTDIQTTLNRELQRATILALTPDEGKLYKPERPLFGPNFADRFQTQGLFELDEAAKCRALGRPTAAVFHLMRIMEIGIRAVAKCLDIPDPTKPVEKNWGAILKAVKAGIDKKWPNGAGRMKGDGALFEDLFASLDAVKNPWRNPTMHVENKYTDEEADYIFSAVRGFMSRVAHRLDENGEPKA
ncbi:MAG TPA: hypothetical protein VKR31_00385 [Rhizomicrobium sp.]|nr:hypothetical protein [Rhizomicrobium sp.]